MSKTIKLSAALQKALDKFENAVAFHAEGVAKLESVDIMERRDLALEVARNELTRLLLQQQSRLKAATKVSQSLPR